MSVAARLRARPARPGPRGGCRIGPGATRRPVRATATGPASPRRRAISPTDRLASATRPARINAAAIPAAPAATRTTHRIRRSCSVMNMSDVAQVTPMATAATGARAATAAWTPPGCGAARSAGARRRRAPARAAPRPTRTATCDRVACPAPRPPRPPAAAAATPADRIWRPATNAQYGPVRSGATASWLEPVADTADRPHVAGRARVVLDLLPQPAHVDGDRRGVPGVEAPHLLAATPPAGTPAWDGA